MNVRLCTAKALSVTAVQNKGYGWTEALKELLPDLEVQVIPFSTQVGLKLDKKTQYIHPDDWAVVCDGTLTVWPEACFDLVFGDDR